MQDVGAVCHQCHHEAMVPVHQKFHWPEFGMLTVEDPILGEDMPFTQFMQMLNLSLTGVVVDLEQGQTENARKHVAALGARMVELEASCEGCHDTPRSYFVDQTVKELIAGMDAALSVPEPDAGAVAAAVRGVGEKSCAGCHLVHVPAAFAQKGAH